MDIAEIAAAVPEYPDDPLVEVTVTDLGSDGDWHSDHRVSITTNRNEITAIVSGRHLAQDEYDEPGVTNVIPNVEFEIVKDTTGLSRDHPDVLEDVLGDLVAYTADRPHFVMPLADFIDHAAGLAGDPESERGILSEYLT